MTYQCAILGDITLDKFLLLPETSIIPSPHNPGNYVINLEIGQKIPVSNIYESLGGNAYNVTFGLQLLDIQSTLITSLGTDELSHYIIHFIQNLNISTQHIIQTPHSGVNQSTILSINGERVVLSHHKPKDYTNLTIPSTEWLYITSLSQGSESMLQSIIEQKALPYHIAFNPGSYLLRHHMDIIHQLLPKTHMILLNKEEAQHITNTREESIPHLIDQLHTMGVVIVGLTDGTHGAYVSTKGKIQHLESRKVTITETTGAGDAFAAAFLAAFIHSQDVTQALRWGIIQSSAVLQKIGSVNGLMSKDDIITLAHSLEPQPL